MLRRLEIADGLNDAGQGDQRHVVPSDPVELADDLVHLFSRREILDNG